MAIRYIENLIRFTSIQSKEQTISCLQLMHDTVNSVDDDNLVACQLCKIN
jgi:hypothetical protein